MTLTARSFYVLLSVDDVRRESHSTFYLGRHADFVILIQLVLQNLVQFWAGMYKLDGKDTVELLRSFYHEHIAKLGRHIFEIIP